MKTKKVHKILRKVAKKNDIKIDAITGFDQTINGELFQPGVSLYGKDEEGSQVLLHAGRDFRDPKGKVITFQYINTGDFLDGSDDVVMQIDVVNFKKFSKQLGDHLTRSPITANSMDNVLTEIEALGGVNQGIFAMNMITVGGVSPAMLEVASQI